MRIGDNNLLEIGCRVECPSMGSSNTIGAKARLHHTVRLGSHCAVGPRCLVVPTTTSSSANAGANNEREAELRLDDYSVLYGPEWEERTWSGRGKVQEADLRAKHVEYLKEMLPKFNRLRKENGA